MVSPTLQSAMVLMPAMMKPISPGPSSATSLGLGVNTPTLSRSYDAAAAIMRMRMPFFSTPSLHAHQGDDAEVRVVPAVDQQRLQGRVAVAHGRRQALDHRLQQIVDAEAGLGRHLDGLGRVDADHVLDLLADPVGIGRGQVDLVQDRDDLVVGVDRVIGVGQRLRLDALAGIDHQQRALAGGQRAADLVGEVDMARRVHQIEHVGLAVERGVVEPHRLRLDGDAALALDVHGIEHLVVELALAHRATAHQQPIGQRALAVVDMGDDREIADQRQVGHFILSGSAGLRPAS